MALGLAGPVVEPAHAAGLRSLTPHALYLRMLSLRPDGFRCHRNEIADQALREDERFRERLRALRPWFERVLGAGELDRMNREFDEEMDMIHFNACPSDYARLRARSKYRRILNELERRARRDAKR
jgi:hypothetical protein